MATIAITADKNQAIFLRPFSLSDTGKIFQMSLESGMKEWIPDQVYADSAEAGEVLEFLIQQYESGTPDQKPIVLGICLKSNNELIGHVGLNPCREGVEIGYAIETCQQKKGFATEAIKAMTSWAFSRYKLPCIWGIVASKNTASCKTLEKAGFSLVREENRKMHNHDTLARIYKIS